MEVTTPSIALKRCHTPREGTGGKGKTSKARRLAKSTLGGLEFPRFTWSQNSTKTYTKSFFKFSEIFFRVSSETCSTDVRKIMFAYIKQKLPPTMPRKSNEAKAKKAAKNRDDKPVQQWYFVLSSSTDSDGAKHARATREEYHHYCRRLCAIAIMASRHENQLKKAEREEAEGDDEESEGDDESDPEEGSDDDEVDDLDLSVEEYIDKYWDELDEDKMMDVSRTYYEVTCLEVPQDLNYVCKLHKGVSKRMIRTVLNITADRTCVVVPECLNIDPIRSVWGVLRYLVWGVNDNGHKSIADVDKTPLFGYGDIEFPKKNRDEIVRRTVESNKFTHFDEIEDWCWYKNSTMRFFIPERVLMAEVKMYREKRPRDVESSTAASRAVKLRKYADIDSVNGDDIQNIYYILHHNNRQPSEFREFALRHLTTDRQGSSLQPILVGESGCGKGALTAPFKELLHTGKLPQSNSAYKWRHLDNQAWDMLVGEEFEKSLRLKKVDEDEMCDIMINTADLQDPYCKLSAFLPIWCNAQSMYVKVEDYKSAKRRLDPFKLHGDTLPKVCDGKLRITGAAMSHFLYNPDEDAAYKVDELPTYMTVLEDEDAAYQPAFKGISCD